MLERDQKYVALFIDWDNLVISTAAEMGGVAPDLRRIVQQTQQYGTVLIAKAYAEWQSTADKLLVYRNGIEPVYAPTFRFEAEAASRGKSLADPCMVADIVDSLHLFPMISTFVIVTGDKDLIPVVRLAQLRGKRFVVIGPDLVAGVLRDMADEFVSYRGLVENEAGKPTQEQSLRRGSGAGYASASVNDHSHQDGSSNSRHSVNRGTTSSSTAANSTSNDSNGSRSSSRRGRVDSRTRGESTRSRAVANKAEPVQQEAAPAPAVVDAVKAQQAEREATAATDKAQQEDLTLVYAAVTEILQQRAAEGKPRVRATNLKDTLMQRISGFSERRYGFGKFKDLLTAAEADGLVKVRIAGPVHWVSLPDKAEASPESATEVVKVESVEDNTAPIDAAQLEEMVRFVDSLRQRSRWLTYTYLLTNTIGLFAKSGSQSGAETKARSVLNALVHEGILRIDKDPQEVEVAGAKHRVRMCHLEDENDLVKRVIAPDGETVSASVDATTTTSTNNVSDSAMHPAETMAAVENTEDSTSASDEYTKSEAAAAVEAAEAEIKAVERKAEGTAVDSEAATDEPKAVDALNLLAQAKSADDDNGAEQSTGQDDLLVVAPVGRAAETQAESASSSRGVSASPASKQADPSSANHTEETPGVAEAEKVDDTSSDSAAETQRVFSLLAEIVRDNTGPKRPRMGAAGLKTRLAKALGGFDEHAYGFSRFKDFLLEANKQGFVRVDAGGQITWVLPIEQQ